MSRILNPVFSTFLFVLLTLSAGCSCEETRSVKRYCEMLNQAAVDVRECSGNPLDLGINKKLSTEFANDSVKLSGDDKDEIEKALCKLADALISKQYKDLPCDLQKEGYKAVRSMIRAKVRESVTLGELVTALNNE